LEPTYDHLRGDNVARRPEQSGWPKAAAHDIVPQEYEQNKIAPPISGSEFFKQLEARKMIPRPAPAAGRLRRTRAPMAKTPYAA
jgi:hypothetical protein